MNLDEILIEMIEREGSDLHIKAGRPPLIRIAGELLPTEHDPTSSEEILEALTSVMAPETKEIFEKKKGINALIEKIEQTADSKNGDKIGKG